MRQFHTKLVGVTFPNPDGSNRQWVIAQCRVGEDVVLSREHGNPYDRNAIRACRYSGQQLGYLSRDLAASLAPDMDSGDRFDAEISSLTGGVPGKPTRGVNLLIEYYPIEIKASDAPSLTKAAPVSSAVTVSPAAAPDLEHSKPRRRRLSLTKVQRASVAGAEFLALLRVITADGVVEDLEIAELQQWLQDHVAEDMPSIGFLASIVKQILADGVVTPREREEFHGAIETVLPPEIRAEAVAARRAAESRQELAPTATTFAVDSSKPIPTAFNLPVASPSVPRHVPSLPQPSAPAIALPQKAAVARTGRFLGFIRKVFRG